MQISDYKTSNSPICSSFFSKNSAIEFFFHVNETNCSWHIRYTENKLKNCSSKKKIPSASEESICHHSKNFEIADLVSNINLYSEKLCHSWKLH